MQHRSPRLRGLPKCWNKVSLKILKANYTRPESSALLCALALPELKSDPKKVKIADFACGTGSLLNGVYQRLLMLYEQAGSNGETIHQYMMEKNLVGCDILRMACLAD